MEREHEISSEPISISRCRELLGADADGFSDSEVDRVRRHAEIMAHVIVEIFLERCPPQE
jgi:hypothetical protein